MNEQSDLEPPVFAFPWRNEFKVGDVFGLSTGYIFHGDIFNGKYIGDLYRFEGVYARDHKKGLSNKIKRRGSNRIIRNELYIFSKLGDVEEHCYGVCGGKFGVYVHYSGTWGDQLDKSLAIELTFDPFVWGKTIEDVIDAYNGKYDDMSFL